jgi:hypothetical protein
MVRSNPMYAECAVRARALAANDAFLESGSTTLVKNPGNLELFLFLRCEV